MPQRPIKVAILTSGGIDSSLLVARALERGWEVYPYYLRFGMHWEEVEIEFLKKMLAYLKDPRLREPAIQAIPYREWFPEHWGFHPDRTPKLQAPDPAVYIPGRNIFLIACATAYAHRMEINKIWIGSLKGNSFKDGKVDFFQIYSEVLGDSFPKVIPIEEPYIHLDKNELIKQNPEFPYALTLTCIKPQGRRHCGTCQKCGERQRNFQLAGVQDPTDYATL